MNKIRHIAIALLLRDTRGLSFVEYMVLVAVVGLGLIGAWMAFGGAVQEALQGQGDTIRALGGG